MKKVLLVNLILFAGIVASYGQITIGTAQTPQQLVEDVLVGSGVTVSNVVYAGNAAQIGSFNGTASNIGFAGGVVLSSGGVTTLPGSAITNPSGAGSQFGGPGDASLLQVAQSVTTNPSVSLITSTKDRAILEFDFIPSSNQVNFNFVFGSDEYLTYVNSQFNDVFGFFVSGPGISGPYAAPAGFPNGAANLAVVPNTTLPITISTIHPGLNSQYYLSNAGGTTHSLNGFTVPIPVSFAVQCDSVYHFKFAIADCQDDYLNTAVFLEKNSFTSPPVNFNITGPSGTGGITTITEGCSAPAMLYFTRSLCQASNPITVNYTVGGSATEGVDYNNLVNPLQLAAGQDSAFILVSAVDDGIAEGTEYIVISYSYVNENGDTITTQGTVAITDPAPINVSLGADKLLKCEGDSTQLTATVTGGGGASNYQYAWQPGGQTTASINTGPLNDGTYTYILTVTGACDVTDSDTIKVVVNQTLQIDDVITSGVQCGMMDGVISALVSGQTGQIHYQWTSTNGIPPISASVYENLPAGTYYFTATDDVCSVDTTITLNVENPPTAAFTPSVTSGCSPLSVTFTNESVNTDSYVWNTNGTEYAAGAEDQNATFNQTTVVYLIATAGACKDTAEVTITVNTCGCTNPVALNYNPNATVDDGSCIMPQPEAVAPNVFTPNGDGINDFFELKLSDVVNLELEIIDRWGNQLFQGSGTSPKWDGKINGELAPDGVYFYKYKGTGIKDTIEGHGFLHLVRN